MRMCVERISIGCSDFSSKVYTLCDKKGIENFALTKDETDYVIPVLREVLAINPNLKIMASPWTCPKWMKVKEIGSGTPYDSWTGGRLNPAYYETYAQYFVKFIEAFRSAGIPIYAVTPQNEPLHSGNCASLYLPWEDEAALISHMAPAFKRAGLNTKIYCFDHNYNYDNVAGQEDYPVKVYNALSGEMEGSELVVGSAWHNYGGSPSELDDIHQQAPDKEIVFTEASIGTWNDGRNLQARLIDDMKNLMFSCEMFCDNVREFRKFFPRSIELLREALKQHRKEMKRLLLAEELVSKTVPAKDEYPSLAGTTKSHKVVS
mgnify:CR=1 FL=1